MVDSEISKINREKLMQAGAIAAQALNYVCDQVAPNVPLLDLVESGRRYIHELGGQAAFPINISINHLAAHYTPKYNDSLKIPEPALVKVDLGVHIDGYIADNARTIIVGTDERMQQLVDAAQAGLHAAIAEIRAGLRVWDISKVIASAIYRFGVRPIENLTGHSIERFNLHAGISIPSIALPLERRLSPRLMENTVIAIEPFTTYSPQPRVVNLGEPLIFGFVKQRNPQTPELRRLFSKMKMNFAQLPFASRWLAELISPDQIDSVISTFQKEGCIQGYSVLGLPDRSFVAQAEHTIIVEKDGCTITTVQSGKGV